MKTKLTFPVLMGLVLVPLLGLLVGLSCFAGFPGNLDEKPKPLPKVDLTFGVKIPMRDCVKLHASIYKPQKLAKPRPNCKIVSEPAFRARRPAGPAPRRYGAAVAFVMASAAERRLANGLRKAETRADAGSAMLAFAGRGHAKNNSSRLVKETRKDLRKRQMDDAIKLLNKAIKAKPGNAHLYILRGGLFWKQG